MMNEPAGDAIPPLPLTSEQRTHRSRRGAHNKSWAQTTDPAARTAAARCANHDRFLVEGSVEWFLYLPTFDPEKRAIDIDTIDLVTRGQRAKTKMICAYILLGLSYAEIGERIGTTTHAVEYRMRALRKHVNKLVERGLVEPPRCTRDRQQHADAREVA